MLPTRKHVFVYYDLVKKGRKMNIDLMLMDLIFDQLCMCQYSSAFFSLKFRNSLVCHIGRDSCSSHIPLLSGETGRQFFAACIRVNTVTKFFGEIGALLCERKKWNILPQPNWFRS